MGWHNTIRFNLVIERLLISGAVLRIAKACGYCFNLVIERLLISGHEDAPGSFQEPCFNLVIERLLISGPVYEAVA